MRDRKAGLQRGSITLELLSLLPMVLVVALTMFQISVTAAAATAAQNAARSASRAAAMGQGNPTSAGRASLPSWLRSGALITVRGTSSNVRVRVPLFVPGLSVGAITVARDATFPRTD